MVAIELRVSTKDPVLSPLYALLKKGRYAALRKRAIRLLKKHPANARLYALVGAACAGLADVENAIGYYQRAIELDGDDAHSYQDLGNLFFVQADYPQAISCFVQARALGAQGAALSFCLGTALLRSNRLREALSELAKALSADPGNAVYALRLGEAFEHGGFHKEAIESLEIACSVAPDDIRCQIALARCLYEGGYADRALAKCDQCLTADPNSAELHTIRSAALGALGRLDEAKRASRDALQDDKATVRHLYNFAMRHDMSFEPETVQLMSAMLQKSSLPKEKRALHFALAKGRDDLGDVEQAYRHLLAGNALRKQELGYDFAVDQQRFASLKQVFRNAMPSPNHPAAGATPIFIVGMPRSGSTLVETILAQHTDVVACGEMNALLQSVIVSVPSQTAPSSEEAVRLAQTYQSHLPTHAKTARFVTDKMPENFRLIGHILTSMPNAKIVHTHRDPRAVCWSNFKTSFSSEGNGFCYDPDDLVAYYKGYADLMGFWHRQFPNNIYDLNYESLVENQEQEIRALVDYVGVGWQDACLSPQSGRQMVATASQAQVRREIYKGSSQKWRRYEAQAGHWLAELSNI